MDFEKEHDNIGDLITSKTCLNCVVSLGKRKMAYLYTMQFLDENDIKFFKTMNVRKFISEVCPFDEEINPHVIKVIVDLLTSDLIEVYRKGNRRTYKVKELKDEKQVLNFCLLRGFGLENGIKTTIPVEDG
jgi:hypothetical protein